MSFLESVESEATIAFDEHCHHSFNSANRVISVGDDDSICSEDERSSSEDDVDNTSHYEPPVVSPGWSLV